MVSPEIINSPNSISNADTVEKMGKFKKSWLLTKSAWAGFKLDKELAALPVFGTALYAFVIAAVIGLAIATAPSKLLFDANWISDSGELTITPLGYALLILTGLVLSAISTFISASVIHGALERFKGNDPTIKSSLKAAWRMIGSLSLFAAFSFTIGYIISAIAERLPVVGGMVLNWLAGAAWGIASFFAIPIIVSGQSPIGPIKATKGSVGLIKKVWGESLIASASIALIAFIGVMLYTAVAATMLGLLASINAPSPLMISLVVLISAGLLIITLLLSVMSAFVKAAIFHYATTGQSPASFNSQLMRQAFTIKKARKVFGL